MRMHGSSHGGTGYASTSGAGANTHLEMTMGKDDPREGGSHMYLNNTFKKDSSNDFALRGEVGPSLARFCQVLRPYQQAAVDRALAVPAGQSLLLAAPTGTGKGSIELGLLKALLERGADPIIVTPSIEVLRGYLERCGATPEDLLGSNEGLEGLVELGRSIRVYTPVRLRNTIRRGEWLGSPTHILVDEAHHAVADNVAGGGLRELIPNATWVGFTATPFRGSPEETEALKSAWGETHTVVSIPQAVELGAWALPTWRVAPIVDDDDCGIKGGDINADEVTIDQVGPLADLLRGLDLSVPTCVTVPCVAAAQTLAAKLEGTTPLRTILGTTPAEERTEAYTTCQLGGTLLISVKVLGEGVDMPWLRRWVDASPTLSPVAFLQKLGRITRPGSRQPEYVGTNRNLERHGYLLQGALPRAVVKEAQEAFGGPSSRGGRAGLLKCVRRAKPIELTLKDGVKATMWSLWQPSPSGGAGAERCIILDPTSDRVISATRDLHPEAVEVKDRYGRWTRSELPKDNAAGFKTSRLNGACSEGQWGWWRKAAEKYGIDASVRPSRAQFFALPVLTELGESIVAAKEASAVAQGATVVAPQLPNPAPAAPQEAPKDPPVTRGHYTVVREDGTRRTYRARTMAANSRFAPGKTVIDLLTGPENTSSYTGIAFADSTGLRVWSKHKHLEASARADWAAIVGDLAGAGKRYALRIDASM